MTVRIIGVDCATQDSKVGMCLAEADDDRLRILEVASGKEDLSPLSRICGWITSEAPVLLALDAPLGWPEPLSRSLVNHSAGRSIHPTPDELFRRSTDHIVEQILGKRPLEVGADRIARTAHAALSLVSKIGEREGVDVPLAWKHQELSSLSAIEVYPAATLKARSLLCEGYKGRVREGTRLSLLWQLRGEFVTRMDDREITADDNIFDALMCALAAYDFLEGVCLEPTDMELARREGWIWFRRPEVDSPS